MKIPKQEYTAEFKELAVRRVKEGVTAGGEQGTRSTRSDRSQLGQGGGGRQAEQAGRARR